MPSFRSNFTLRNILLFALALRLLFFFLVAPWQTHDVNKVIEDYDYDRVLYSDAVGYHNLAINMMNRNFFSINGEFADAFRTPGYPFFVMLVYSVFGVKPWIVLVLQILLSLASIYLIYKLASRMYTEKIGRLAAFLFSLDPLSILFASSLFTETLFVFLLIATVYYLYIFLQRWHLPYIAICALALAACILTRPIAIFLPWVIGALIIVKGIRPRPVKSIASVLILTVLLAPPLLLWKYRNEKEFSVNALSSNGSHTLLYYDVVYTEMVRTGKDHGTVINEIFAELKKRNVPVETFNNNIANVQARSLRHSPVYETMVKEYITAHPKDFFALHFKNSMLTYLNVGTTGFLRAAGYQAPDMPEKTMATGGVFNLFKHIIRSKPWFELLIIFLFSAFFLVCYLFAAYGIYSLLKQKKYFGCLLLLLILGYFTFTLGANGNSARFKLPMVPFYSILAACGIQAFLIAKPGLFRKKLTN